LQVLQVQGLQRQPPVLQLQVGAVVASVLFIASLLGFAIWRIGFYRPYPGTESSMKSSAADMTIARLAAAAGVGVETVRYYQRRGLLPVPASAGAVRRYDAQDVRRLRFIRRAQAAGFTLEEIGELLALDRTGDRARVRELATARLASLDAKIAELEQARTALDRLRSTCASGSRGPCPIIEAFDGH
jgi:MerR family mercuric resistance operon transcriptional regulator